MTKQHDAVPTSPAPLKPVSKAERKCRGGLICLGKNDIFHAPADGSLLCGGCAAAPAVYAVVSTRPGCWLGFCARCAGDDTKRPLPAPLGNH